MSPQILETVETLLTLRRLFSAAEKRAKDLGVEFGEAVKARDALSDDIYKLEKALRDLIVEEALRD